MNGFYNDFDHIVIETAEEREEKRKNVKGLFSMVFMALFVYALLQLLITGIYIGAAFFLTEEQFLALQNNTAISLLINAVVQYVIALPVLVIMLSRTETARSKETATISVKDLFLYFCVAMLLMLIGNLIGTFLSESIGRFIGKVPENSVASVIDETPMWMLIAIAVVIGPIVEEFIFRKLLIDRLSIYGDHIAIGFSAVAFGLFHGNLYQLFYATLIGIILGYIYCKTRNVKYTMILHMAVNFMGSIVALVANEAGNAFSKLFVLFLAGDAVDMMGLLTSGAIFYAYIVIYYGLIIGGALTLFNFIKKKEISVSHDKEIYIPDGEVIKCGIKNPGTIMFIIICAIYILLSLA